MIDALRERYRLKELLSLFCISKSSYCYQVKCRCRNKYSALREKVRHLFYSSNRCYGYRRIYQMLKKEGTIVSEKVIRTLMREEGLRVCSIRRRKYNSYVGEVTPAAPNLLQRDFHAAVPNTSGLRILQNFLFLPGKYTFLLLWIALMVLLYPGR